MESIIQSDKKCYLCGTTNNLASHHIIYGSANRKLSEKYGLKVWLCNYHHNMGGKNCIHENIQLDLMLKQLAQRVFEKVYPDLDFLKIFGKNYNWE